VDKESSTLLMSGAVIPDADAWLEAHDSEGSLIIT
jgi:hypothetical protein